MHVVALDKFKVSVTEPGLQTAQGTVDTALYVPEEQLEQLVPPTDSNEFVTEPASHGVQVVCPSLS